MTHPQHIATACLLLALLFLGLAAPAGAAPSHEDPDAPLAVRPEDESRRLQGEAAGLYQGARTALDSFLEKKANNRLLQIKPKAIGEVHVAVLRIQRLAEHLITLGEPAGIDFQLRAKELRNDLGPLIQAYRTLPGAALQLRKDFQILSQNAQKQANAIPKAGQLADRGEWERAKSTLDEAVDLLESMAVWYTPEERKRVINRFLDAQQLVGKNVQELRQKRAAEALAEARIEQTPDFEGLVSQVLEAADEIRAGGKAELDGEILAGPALVERFGQRWQEVQHGAVRCRGLDWSRKLATGEPPASELTALMDRQARFSEDVVTALAGLIAADAARVPAAEARGLYLEYLAVLAPLVSLAHDDAATRAVSPALEQLASKSPALAAEVAAYGQATAELLRWRQRTAEAYARARLAPFPPLEQAFLEATRVSGETPGLVFAGAQDTTKAMLNASAPAVMRPATEKLLGEKVTLADLVGLPTATKMAVSRYRARTYARITLPEPLAGEVTALESALLVHEGAPPLTLEAAMALATARRGDLALAGGEITGLYLEALATRFATLSAAGRSLVPLGPLAPEPVDPDPLRQMLMRFDVNPLWGQHRYFFVELK